MCLLSVGLVSETEKKNTFYTFHSPTGTFPYKGAPMQEGNSTNKRKTELISVLDTPKIIVVAQTFSGPKMATS